MPLLFSNPSYGPKISKALLGRVFYGTVLVGLSELLIVGDLNYLYYVHYLN